MADILAAATTGLELVTVGPSPLLLDIVISASSNLEFHYRLDEASGPTALEAVSQSMPYAGRYDGAYTLAGPFHDQGAIDYRRPGPGGLGDSARLSGAATVLAEFNAGTELRTPALYIEVWFRFDEWPTASAVIFEVFNLQNIDGLDHESDTQWARLRVGTNGAVTASAAAGFDAGSVTSAPAAPGVWHQAVFYVGYSVVTFWLDGVQVGSDSYAGNGASMNRLRLGAGSGSFASGIGLAHVAFYGSPYLGVPEHYAALHGDGVELVPLTNLRVTGLAAEVLRTGGGAFRATEVVAEVLRNGTPAMRATEVTVEVLRAAASHAAVVASATTGLEIGSGGIAEIEEAPPPPGVVPASATTVLILGTGAAGHVPADIPAAAATGLDLGVDLGWNIATLVLADATTGLDLGSASEEIPVTFKYATATTAFDVRARAPVPVQRFATAAPAETGLALAHRATATVARALVAQAHTTLLLLAHADADDARGLSATATTGLSLGSDAAARADLVASAGTALEVAPAATPKGRDIYAFATTSMGMGTGERTNEFHPAQAADGIELGAGAAAATTGTLADTGLVLVHRADAVIWLDWRLAALTSAPGGQLPH